MERLGVSVEPALTERIVSEVHDRPGALPSLQHALSELFEARSSNLLTVGTYEQVGGVTGSLARRAESIFEAFDEPQRLAAEQILLRLVTVSDDAAPTRRRVRLTEFDDAVSRSVVDAFARGRLIVFDSDPDTRTPTIEVAHEALLSHWPRLAGWIEATREDLTSARRLEQARSEWEASDRDETHLLTGGRLAQHEAWTADTSLTLADAEKEYLAISRGHDEMLMGRRRRRRRTIMAGFGVAAIISVVGGLLAWSNAREADTQRVNAEARSLLASATAVIDEDPDLALSLATQGATLLPEDAGALEVLRDALRLSRTIYYDPVTFGPVGLSPDGTRVAEGGAAEDGGVAVRDVDTGELVWASDVAGPAPDESFLIVLPVFVNDGREVAVSVAFNRNDRSPEPPDTVGLYVLDAETGAVTRSYEWEGCGPALADNTAVGSFVLVWNICDPEAVPLQLHWMDVNTGEILSVGPPNSRKAPGPGSALSADARRVAWYDNDQGVVTVTDVDSGTELTALPDLSVGSLALSSDGSVLAVGGSSFGSGTGRDQSLIRIFEVDTGQEVAALESDTRTTTASVRFLDGDRSLISYSGGGELRIWDLAMEQVTATISPGDSGAALIGVSADGSRVAISSESAKVLSLDPMADVGALVACEFASFYVSRGLEVSGDRVMSQVLCPEDDGIHRMRGHVFDLDTQSLVAAGPHAAGQGMALSADGGFLAGHDARNPTDSTPRLAGPVMVTDIGSGDQAEMEGICWFADTPLPPEGEDCRPPPEEPYAAWADDIDFSPDGRFLAMAPQYGGPGRVWDPATGETLGPLGLHCG